jgi:hypothetical protein
VSKSKTLRNTIIGVAVAVLVVCIAIPMFPNLFPWWANGDPENPPVYTIAPQETLTSEPETEAPAEPETDPNVPAYVEPDTGYVAPTPAPTTKTPTTKKPTVTKAPTTKAPTTKVPTTTKAPTTAAAPEPTAKITLPDSIKAPAGTSTLPGSSGTVAAVPAPVNGEADPRAVLSYKMNAVEGYFYTEQNAWQRPFGFNKTFDLLAQFIMMFYDTTRVRFTYGGHDWMVQLWKGQYGFMFLGSEVGVYYLPEGKGSKNAHYKAVPDADMLNMSTALFNFGEFQAKRPYQPYWWCTTFVPGTLSKNTNRSQLRLEMVIEMKDSAMGDAFEAALTGNGFALSGKNYADCIKTGFDHSDVYARSGAKFAINWSNVKDEGGKKYDHPEVEY